MDDKYDAYSFGFEAGSAGSGVFNDNPYDANEERELYDEYERGFADGKKAERELHDEYDEEMTTQ